MKKLKEIIKKNYTLYCVLNMMHLIYIKIIIGIRKRYNDKQRRHFIEKMYCKRIGKKLDWNSLRSYNEKMQWAKLYGMKYEMGVCADKYLVREFVKKRVGEKYLIPLLGVWDDAKDINFGLLPNRFVLKCTGSSGSNIIVKDKNALDKKITIKRLNTWKKFEYAYLKGFEMQYSYIPQRIIAEEYIECNEEDLPDYKFLCFNGKVYYCWVDVGRYHTHKRNIYDLQWNLQDWNQYDYGNSDNNIPKPENFSEMIELASKLCQGFSHVRVDLYNVSGRIFFGEMTFTNGSGFEKITPDEANIMLGELWDLNTANIHI